MCGIFGCLVHPNDADFFDADNSMPLKRIIQRLGYAMAGRGKDATGIATVKSNGSMRLIKDDIPSTVFFSPDRKWETDRSNPWGALQQARLVIGHTRFATQGKPEVWANNHPIVSGRTVGVHNGHIYNDHSLFKKNKWQRIGEVDSEAIFAAIDKTDSVRKALEMVEGAMATAWFDLTNPDELWLARGSSSPLVVASTVGGSIFFCSETSALVEIEDNLLLPEPKFRQIRAIPEGRFTVYTAADHPDGFPVDPDKWSQFEEQSGWVTYGGTTYVNYVKPYDSGWEWGLTSEGWGWKRKPAAVAKPKELAPVKTVITPYDKVDEMIDPFDEVAGEMSESAEEREIWAEIEARIIATNPAEPKFRPGDIVIQRGGTLTGTVRAVDGDAVAVDWHQSIEAADDLDWATEQEDDYIAYGWRQFFANRDDEDDVFIGMKGEDE